MAKFFISGAISANTDTDIPSHAPLIGPRMDTAIIFESDGTHTIATPTKVDEDTFQIDTAADSGDVTLVVYVAKDEAIEGTSV